MSDDIRCLVTGATGYIGGLLVPQLLDAGLGCERSRAPRTSLPTRRGAMTWRWRGAI